MENDENKPAPLLNRQNMHADPSLQTRRKLLESATQVFVERGYYAATVRDICKRAELNIAMVNYHFGDKLCLYTEVLESTSLAFRPELFRHINDPDTDPTVLLQELVAMFLRNMRQTANAFDILMQQERLRPTPAMQYLVETSMRPAYLASCALIGRILGLPADDERTRIATHSVIAQIKHFGEPERLLSQLDPSILSLTTVESLAETIVQFSLASFHNLRHPGTEGKAATGCNP